jgi:hypothetical protein
VARPGKQKIVSLWHHHVKHATTAGSRTALVPAETARLG